MSGWKKKENEFCKELWCLDDSIYVILRNNGVWGWYYSYSHYRSSNIHPSEITNCASREQAMSNAIECMKIFLTVLKKDRENISKEINKIEVILKDIDGG